MAITTRDFGRESSELVRTQDLLQGARDGDETSWRLIFERHRDFLLFTLQSLATRGTANRIDPEDVLQTSLLRAWKNISNFEYQGDGSLRWWLKKIVLNTFVDQIREEGRVKRGGSLAAEQGLTEVQDLAAAAPSEAAYQNELKERLLQCLARLPEEDRDLVIMRMLEQLGWQDIADLLGVPRTSCRRRYEQALDRLQRWMA
ncbi:MAG: RNA polymerase sigma factor [Planctomycetota bacterium]